MQLIKQIREEQILQMYPKASDPMISPKEYVKSTIARNSSDPPCLWMYGHIEGRIIEKDEQARKTFE